MNGIQRINLEERRAAKYAAQQLVISTKKPLEDIADAHDDYCQKNRDFFHRYQFLEGVSLSLKKLDLTGFDKTDDAKQKLSQMALSTCHQVYGQKLLPICTQKANEFAESAVSTMLKIAKDSGLSIQEILNEMNKIGSAEIMMEFYLGA